MLKKTITYTDWNGAERTEDFYFNLTRVECIELEYGFGPGASLTETFSTMINSNDPGMIIKVVKDVILKAYGEKSPDGKRFVKNPEIRKSFEENPAFDILYMELMTNSDYAAEFMVGIMPAELQESTNGNAKNMILDKVRDYEQTGKI